MKIIEIIEITNWKIQWFDCQRHKIISRSSRPRVDQLRLKAEPWLDDDGISEADHESNCVRKRFQELTRLPVQTRQLSHNGEREIRASPSTTFDEVSALISILSVTLYVLLATLSQGRCLRLMERVSIRHKFKAWRELMVDKASKAADRVFALLQCVLHSGLDQLRFEEISWQLTMKMYDLTMPNLDEHV